MPLASSDGTLVEKSSLRISVTDYGFARGLTIFELARVYGGKVFRLDDHLNRLQNGAAFLGLSLPSPIEKIKNDVAEIIAENKFPHSAIKFYLTAGESQTSPQSFAAPHNFTSHLVIIEDEIHPQHPEAPYGLETYIRGQKIRIMPVERTLPSIKSTNYAQGFVAARNAGAEWDDILFTHRDGHVTEATKSNFFCVIDGVLSTPGSDMLLGITRKTILEIAQELRIPTAERRLTPDDIFRATEAFTTGSIAEIWPIKQIDNHILPTTMDGDIFKKLRARFTEILAALNPA